MLWLLAQDLATCFAGRFTFVTFVYIVFSEEVVTAYGVSFVFLWGFWLGSKFLTYVSLYFSFALIFDLYISASCEGRLPRTTDG